MCRPSRNDGKHRNHRSRDDCVCSDLLAMGTEAQMTPTGSACRERRRQEISDRLQEQFRRLQLRDMRAAQDDFQPPAPGIGSPETDPK